MAIEVPSPEVLVCDTSFVGHSERAQRQPSKYAHWPSVVLDRVAAAIVAITPFTVAEVRAGAIVSNWSPARVAHLENLLRGYVLIPLDELVLDEYAKLHALCRTKGIGIGQNDMWIAATAISQGLLLVSCDRRQCDLPGVDSIYLPPPAGSES